MDYFRIEYLDVDELFMLTTSLQKQLVLFLISYRKTWVTGTLDCAEDVSGKENMHKIKLQLIKRYIPVY
jgi:hypothetical protein